MVTKRRFVIPDKGDFMRFQIGAFFPTRDMPADHSAIRDWAQAAEAIGFDFIEVPDHVLGADRAALPHFEGPYDVMAASFRTLAGAWCHPRHVLHVGSGCRFGRTTDSGTQAIS